MVIVLFKPKMSENYGAFCSASESSKQNLRDRTLESPSFFHYKCITSLKNYLSVAQGRSLP